jgi:hypothetical protein
MSISGIMSFDSFLTPNFEEALESLSISISEDDCRLKVACSLPMAVRRPLAILFDAGNVSVMTWARISGLSRLRIDEIDRSARRENRASKRLTARSSSAKLFLMSMEISSIFSTAVHIKT